MKNIIKTNKLLVLVFIAYIALAIFMPSKATQSLKNSFYYVKEMLMIMPVILILTSLITAWIPRKTIEKNFGKGSGLKGTLFSFLLGSFSAGPIYAAFPVCKALLGKGASISNIVVVLSTWAVIKVPMLLNEAKFLGTEFMVIRWILTTISILLIGFITSKFVKDKDIPKDGDLSMVGDGQRLSVNQDYCIGCGICAKTSDKHFEMANKKAIVISQEILPCEEKLIEEIAEKCPANAIKLK